MKYSVLKDVVVDGTNYKAGSEVEIHHDKVERLMLLGYLAPVDETKTEDRSIGLDEETKPKRRKKRDS